jgi:hypothetical protein
MAEVLSANRAVYWRGQYLTPLFGSVLVIVGTAAVAVPFADRIMMLSLWLLMSFARFLYGRQFKHIALLDSCLVVSDGKRDVHVPIGNVERVSQGWGMNPPTVMLVLKTPSAFGRRIMFIPLDPPFFPAWRGSRVVRRLRLLSSSGSASSCLHTPLQSEQLPDDPAGMAHRLT